MKLLIIGGTRFLGRHIAECAIARGHELTLFHRGNTNKGLFDVEEILGDRDGETDYLMGRKWDAVIDTCGYFPRVVEQSADVLAENVGLYCFISTISVYKDGEPKPWDETAAVIRFDTVPEKEEVTPEAYGGFKVLCEEAVSNICGSDKTLIIRPGLIVGPHDPSDRFTYWIDRFSRSNPILVPDRASQVTQVIDVRDLAEFTVKAVEEKVIGVYNTTGPADPMTLGEFWKLCLDNCGGQPKEILVSDAFLAENQVQEWADLPLLLPPDADMMEVEFARAVSKGLRFRPMADTIRDTAEWHRGRGDVELKTGLSRAREAELLDKWSQPQPC